MDDREQALRQDGYLLGIATLGLVNGMHFSPLYDGAFVLLRPDYLLATWHPRHRPHDLELDPVARWLGLDVRQHRSTSVDAAEVEFVARQRDATGRASRLHERSRFTREKGRWYYLDGDMLG